MNIGRVTDEAVWVRFSLHNAGGTPLRKELHIDNRQLDSITLFENTRETGTLGRLMRPRYDGITDYHFPISLKPHESCTYWLRIASNSTATYFHLTLLSKEQLWLENNSRQLILTAFLALMGTLVIYNALVFLFTREQVYLFYVLTLGALTYNHLAYTGMTFPLLSPFYSNESLGNLIFLNAHFGIYYYGAIMVFLALFARELLQLRRHPRIERVLFGFIGVILFISLASFESLFLPDPLIYLGLIESFFLFGTAIYLAYKREANGPYYVVGWGVNLAGHLVFLLYHAGYCCVEEPYNYFFELSVSFTALLFSVVLAKRLAKTRALEEALAAQKVLLRELHHRVKNNMQFITSLYRLKLSRELNATQRKKLKEAESGVRAVARIHEILYDGGRHTRIDAAPLMREIAQTLRDGLAEAQKVTVRIEGSAALSMEQAISLGIIVNELLSNAFKHAFGSEGGIITMTFETDKKGWVRFLFEDNGSGYETGEEGTGYGLDLVRSMAQSSLGATWSSDTSGPTRYTLVWKS